MVMTLTPKHGHNPFVQLLHQGDLFWISLLVRSGVVDLAYARDWFFRPSFADGAEERIVLVDDVRLLAARIILGRGCRHVCWEKRRTTQSRRIQVR